MLATQTLLGGRYLLGAVIGRGGGADVYRADDQETGRPVAVKVLRSATPQDLHRFALEAKTLARLDHPAIVRMCDDGEHEGVPYLVLDLIEGETLSSVIARGALSEEEVSRIGGVLADALAHAHELGVVHRDVKPGNVLFDEQGDVHLTDFGIARLTDVTAITATGFVIGTAAYLAPEQVTGEGASPASDIYALGLVLLEALTAERAYVGSPSEAALARLQRPPSIPETSNRSLRALLTSMTATDPATRPSAVAVDEALRLSAGDDAADATAVIPIVSDATTMIETAPAAAAATAAAGAIPTAPPPTPLSSRVDRRGLLAPAIATAIVLFALVMGALFGGRDLQAPAGADTSTTTTATSAPATTLPPPTTEETTPPTEPRGKRGRKGDEGD